ncbi:hypothetical protein QE152_g33189 [Popillia japonica]|uniref:Uncharacterized protein n=1 Tax=Popillia japonica TaxID=7064 RepID=A0AAW1IY80_POPJA
MNKRKRSYSNMQPDSDYIPENEAESSDSDYHKPTDDSLNNKLIHPDIEVNPLPKSPDDKISIRNFINETLEELVETSIALAQRKTYTKEGTIRKRKLYDVPLSERKKQRLSRMIADHTIKNPCHRTCHLQCPSCISVERQKDMNQQFWALNREARNTFIIHDMKRFHKKRNTAGLTSTRINTFKYYLKNNEGQDINVCKIFFLATLGYPPENDWILKTLRKNELGSVAPKPDQRGRHPNKTKIDEFTISEHILSFRPTISHYRREHAPNRLYLPSDISVVTIVESTLQIDYIYLATFQ